MCFCHFPTEEELAQRRLQAAKMRPCIVKVEVSEPVDPNPDNPFIEECKRLTRMVEELQSRVEQLEAENGRLRNKVDSYEESGY